MTLLLSLLLLACDPPVETRTITDEGSVCTNDEGDVEVTFNGCLSSSCDTLVSATCTAELVGDVVEVHAEAVIESQGTVCTDDCGIIVASCELPLIEDPEGVSFEFGGETTALDAECGAF